MYADHFQPEKVIAAGPSAKVYRGVETMTGRKVLIKALQQDEETPYPLDRERVQLLAPSLMQMRHPQIAGLITLLPTEDDFALVSEFMPGMNARALAAQRQTTPNDLRALAVQLMHALLVGEHLRQPHGDPKPSNLIIADHPGGGLFLQVQDWGLSLARQSHPPETLWFRAPELHAGGQPTTQSDLFTAAASLFCIATNTAPAQGSTVAEVMADWQNFNAAHVLSHLRPDLDPPLRDWLAWLLHLAPQMRPHSVAQALDMLMLSMHTGYAYLPQQAPVMAPGAQTMPLVATPQLQALKPAARAQPPTARPQQPAKPSPAQPKAAPVTAAAAATAANAKTPATPAAASASASATAPAPGPALKKASGGRIAMAVVLNLAALILIVFFAWPVISKSMPSVVVSPAVSSEKASSTASPAAATDAKKEATPAPAKPKPKPKPPATSAKSIPAAAVTEVKGR